LQGSHWIACQCGYAGGLYTVQNPRYALAIDLRRCWLTLKRGFIQHLPKKIPESDIDGNLVQEDKRRPRKR
jgi:hypothetical protein